MRVMLTNDDGIYAPGIRALYRVLAEDWDVNVIAPQGVQSGTSHAITIRHPVLWHHAEVATGFEGTAVEGTPADCVKLALHHLIETPPDLVISGINAGLNTGIHVLYSGTVAAAMEAAILGRPSVAVSFELYRDMDFNAAARIAKPIIESVVGQGIPPGCVCNINIPELKPGWPKGVRVVPMSTQHMDEHIEKREDPYGRSYYWLSGDFRNYGDPNDTDRHAIGDGYVSVTPLQFDMTDKKRLEEWAGLKVKLPGTAIHDED